MNLKIITLFTNNYYHNLVSKANNLEGISPIKFYRLN